MPVLKSEPSFQQYGLASILSYVEGKSNVPSFRMLVGWVYPESLKDLEEVNKYVDEMLTAKKIHITYQT